MVKPITDAEKQIAARRCKPQVIQRKTRAIYQATLRESRHIRAGNFAAVAAEDDSTIAVSARLLHAAGEGTGGGSARPPVLG